MLAFQLFLRMKKGACSHGLQTPDANDINDKNKAVLNRGGENTRPRDVLPSRGANRTFSPHCAI